jgi:hypothetical protein
LGIIKGDIPFRGGVIRCSDAFTAGVTLGLHETLMKISDASITEETKLRALVSWTLLESVRLSVEMAEIYRTTEEVREPPPTISSADRKRTASAVALADWVEEHLIGAQDPIHQLCYQTGRRGAVFFSSWLDRREQQAFVQAHGENLARPLRNAFDMLLAEEELPNLGLASMPALRRFLDKLRTVAGVDFPDGALPMGVIPAEALLTAFREDGIEGLDEMIPVVLHTVAPLEGLAIDWDGMRQSIRKIFEGGCLWPAVILSQNGSFGVGKVDPTFQGLLCPVDDPNLEVYFIDEKAVAHMVKKTWPELEGLLGCSISAD